MSSDPCVGPSSRTKVYFLSVCVDDLLPTQKIITFLSQSKAGIKKGERESNPVSHIK